LQGSLITGIFHVEASSRPSGINVTRHRDKSRAEIKVLLQWTFIGGPPMAVGRIATILGHQIGFEPIVAYSSVTFQ
jgi:hypothetical protein